MKVGSQFRLEGLIGKLYRSLGATTIADPYDTIVRTIASLAMPRVPITLTVDQVFHSRKVAVSR
jgi:hypothetical protein